MHKIKIVVQEEIHSTTNILDSKIGNYAPIIDVEFIKSIQKLLLKFPGEEAEFKSKKESIPNH